ncbi:MAG: 3-isopropylmalate dehydratase large subunit [Rhodospirillales bacterium]|nr:3-isopropylmalate dehydratase large subunit [Rhodospirillales bacterium]
MEKTPVPETLFAKIWRRHVVKALETGETLLYIDRVFIHEGSRPGFVTLDRLKRSLRRPNQVIACVDHYIPSHDRHRGLDAIPDPATRQIVEDLEANAKKHGCRLFALSDPLQGILHVVAPEQGITQPGLTIVGGDSHTSTHGAFGALAFGIGASEVMLAMANQALWQTMPKIMRINIGGVLPVGVTPKDMILAIIGQIGIGGGIGHAVEYSGPAIRAMSMEQRMTVSNMTTEAGARTGMMAPDDTTFEYLTGRPEVPTGDMWDRALAYWRTLPSDADALFDAEIDIDGASIRPMATWGTSPEQVVPIDGYIPDPAKESDVARREAQKKALAYMGLKPGEKLTDIAVDKVFIGSCTNGRIEDLREAGRVLKGRRVAVPGIVVPGSSEVKRQAEAEGLDGIFRAAGLEWRNSACSLCTDANGTDTLAPGERCASTSNRNFQGRQGVDVRTHLMSPASVAATAVRGVISSERDL